MSRILGLDLGTNSIGWAFIDDEKKEIIDSGVRIFQEGVSRTTTGSEESKNKNRRDARGARRRQFRYKMRRDALIKAMQKIDLCPSDKDEFKAFIKIDPYKVRKRGLTEQLTLHELGRALYHINQHRGFLSNRKAGGSEDGAIFKGSDDKAGIDAAKDQIGTAFKTIGEYLASLDPHETRQRNRYTLRKWYLDEFDELWKTQQQYHPAVLTNKEKEYIKKVIFYQRPLRSQKHLVGKCTFETNKKCAPKSSPVFQYYRILEQVNRMRISTDERYNEPLDDEERGTLILALSDVKELKFPQILKLLNLPEETKINLDTDKLLGNNTFAEIKKIVGKETYATMSYEQKFELWHTIHFSKDDEWLAQHGRKKWGLDDDGVKKLLKNTMESGANDGYCRLSNKAMTNMLPHLEVGLLYHEAAAEAGYHHSDLHRDRELLDYLPEPENIRNPIVQQALHQIKKVINTFIYTYGKPDIIRVELARELKHSKEKRAQMRIENKIRQREIESIRDRLIKEGYSNKPSRDDVLRYQLWQECGEHDPYSGDKISLEQLYNGEYEIEHIIPFSRSLDDSFMNKTLCRKDLNIQKSNKTPYEAFGQTKEWPLMVARVQKFKAKERFDWKRVFRKMDKFQVQDAEKELDGFVNRQLTDTAYISRASRQYLQQVFENVYIVKGGATAKLRHLWGLNKILSGDVDIKTRDDHRHHAVDALVVANTNSNKLHRLGRYHKYNKGDFDITEKEFPMPWSGFHEQAEASVNKILVSFHLRNRARGKLHEETNYGRIVDPESGDETFVVRKPVETITPKQIGNIVNKETRQLLLNRLTNLGVDVTAKKFTIPKEAFAEPLVHPKTGHIVKSVRVKIPTTNMIPLYGKERKLYVESGSNHHIEIFASADNTKKTGYVVSLYDVVKRKKAGQPIIDKTPRETNFPNFVMSLCINEMFLLGVENKDDIDFSNLDHKTLSDILYRVQKLSTQISLRHHTVSLTGEGDPGIQRPRPNTIHGIKVKINPLGKLEPADD